MMKRSTHYFSQGVSIIEILIAIFLIGVVGIAIIGLATIGTRLSIESERQTVAQAVVNDRIEYIRSLDFNDVGYTDATGDEPDGVLSRSEDIQRNQQVYTTTITVVLIDDPDNTSLPSGGLIEPNADYKLVTVKAVWNSAGGNQRDVSVITIVARGGNLETCTPGQPSCSDGAICPANGVCPHGEPSPTCPAEAYFCGGAATSVDYITEANTLYSYNSAQNTQAQYLADYENTTAASFYGMLDIALSSSGALYGISDIASNPNANTELFQINTTTGQLYHIGTVDATFGDTYVAAEFLSDGRLAVGGAETIKYVTITDGSITNIETLALNYSGGSINFAGDLVELSSGGDILFTGVTDIGDLCYIADPTTGTVTKVSSAPFSPQNTAWGVVCEDSTCSQIRIYTSFGSTRLLDTDTCAPVSWDFIGTRWEGATK